MPLLATPAKGLAGEASCGCFGVVRVHPWITLAIDLGFLAGLVWTRPQASRINVAPPTVCPKKVVAVLLAVWGLVALPLSIAAARVTPARLHDDGSIQGTARIVVLDVEHWAGKSCPLLPHIGAGAILKSGRWQAVLYRHDCPHCQEAIPRFFKEAAGDVPIALIELPPYGKPGSNLVPADVPGLRHCTVAVGRDWFVETPVFFRLDNGMVTGMPRTGGARLSQLLASLRRQELPLVQAQDGDCQLGFIPTTATRQLMLVLTNPLHKTFSITAVKSECACMAAALPQEPRISATGSVRIPLVFVAPEKPTVYDKRLLLVTDDPTSPLLPLRVRAQVGLPITVEPSEPRIGPLALGRSGRLTLTLSNHTPRAVRILFASASDRGVQPLIPPDPIPAGTNLPLTVEVTARAPGRSVVILSLSTDLPEMQQVAVPITVDGLMSNTP